MIRVEEISKKFRSLVVLDKVNIEITDRTVVAILGPSGVGKTVLLRIMAGLLEPDSGRVWFDNRPIRYGMFADNTQVTGGLGFVFQTGALLDSLTVAENIALPLEEHRQLKPVEVSKRVAEVLTQVGMAGTERLFPKVLSGGMTKLVAIARALVLNPRYLFFDEPTSGLDPALRRRIGNLIRSLRDNEDKTCLVVTHDLETATQIADRLFMLKAGRLEPADGVRKEDYEQAYP